MHEHTVLVVEDDPSVSRFVGEALARLELDAVYCAKVSEAMRACEQRSFGLVITDLTFPEGSGLDLIRFLQQRSTGLVTPRVVVFSAGLFEARRKQLTAQGVFHCLAKPASVPQIIQVVRLALGLSDWPEAPKPSLLSVHPDLQPFEVAAIETFFDGDRPFYETFRKTCIVQFQTDLREGDQACASADPIAIRRVAHSLKSVLQTLGHADHALCAQELEQAAQHAPLEEAIAGWAELRRRLVSSFGLSA